MGFKCGIVGLPNVGKSTLFNALTKAQSAEAANYPFCTIEPNIGKVGVPDDRLDKLEQIASSQKKIPVQLSFVDIAGLVRGASKGEGLGNQFLGHIREVDAIIHVVRCFENNDITHVDGSVDPIRDIATIENELILSDLESLERRIQNKKKSKDTELKVMEEAVKVVQGEKGNFSDEELKIFNSLGLLSTKPVLYVCNVGEEDIAQGNSFTKLVEERAKTKGSSCVIICASLEVELLALGDDEKISYLNALGTNRTGLEKVIEGGYKLLDLLTFFTIGPKEAHAWVVYKGATAPQAAGVIHTDFERGFICAETISYNDYIEYNGEAGAKAAGKVRLEGKSYIVNDGDVFHFRFNV